MKSLHGCSPSQFPQDVPDYFILLCPPLFYSRNPCLPDIQKPLDSARIGKETSQSLKPSRRTLHKMVR